MPDTAETITKDEALRQIRLALRRCALIYHSFARTLIDELGEKRGRELIRRAVDDYGERIGAEARRKAEQKGLPLSPDSFESDLPDLAWRMETVTVDGEERVRVHECPLAEDWRGWGDAATGRIYCFVDQAKMRAFNPDYEYVHVRNVLDGDPYCELAVRRIESRAGAPEAETPEAVAPGTVQWLYGKYTADDLRSMDPACLRALFRERVHHTIEVLIYPILLGERKVPAHFGCQPELILKIWRERGLPETGPDFDWGREYICLARDLREGRSVQLPAEVPAPFSETEMEVLRKLIWKRHSIRDWLPGKPVSEDLIEQILEAGRAAPTACNLDIVRFVVIRDPEEARMVWSDIPTPMDRCVLILVCYDTRIYQTVGHERLVPHNQLYDCAAAADHMCLMAHALGLGAVWLTRTEKTGQAFKTRYGLPDHIEPALHIAVGWPARGTIKSARMPLSEMRLHRDPA